MSGPTKQALPVQIPPELSVPKYVNAANVSFSTFDFTVDFAYTYPNNSAAEMRARLVMSPQHLKQLAVLLASSLKEWEEKFGAVPSLEGEVVFSGN